MRRAAADGSIRLRPTRPLSIQDQAAGVTGQVWANDQDMLAAVHSRDFADGMVSFAPDELVYGVTYQVTVYDVDGYQPATATVRGGLQDTLIVNITTTASPLMLMSQHVMQQCRPAGQSTNVTHDRAGLRSRSTRPVEDATTSTRQGRRDPGRYVQVIDDDGRHVARTDLSNDGLGTRHLVHPQREHGVISWNPSVGAQHAELATDTINSVTYTNLALNHLAADRSPGASPVAPVALPEQRRRPCAPTRATDGRPVAESEALLERVAAAAFVGAEVEIAVGGRRALPGEVLRHRALAHAGRCGRGGRTRSTPPSRSCWRARRGAGRRT